MLTVIRIVSPRLTVICTGSLSGGHWMTIELLGRGDKLPELTKNFRVPPAFLDFLLHRLQGLTGRHGPLIGPCGGQSVIDIHDLQDASGYGNIVAVKAIGIARAVTLFVMMPDDGKHEPEGLERRADALS